MLGVNHGMHYPVCELEADLPATGNLMSSLRDRAASLTWRHWLTLMLVCGVALRCIRYLSRPPLWGDESYLAVNLIERGFGELTQPLTWTQLAPVSYLWSVRAIIETFGVGELSLRAFAFVAGTAALFTFRSLARQVLTGPALVIAVGLLAVAFYPIRHAAEVKPYASDLFAATLVLLPALAWRKNPARFELLWTTAGCAIVGELLSFTAVFVAGGVGLGLLPVVLRRRQRREIFALAAMYVAVAATFAANISISASASTGGGVGDGMQNFWAEGFPPSFLEPVRLLLWLLQTHTGEALAVPFGSQNGGSALQLVLCCVGAGTLWKQTARDGGVGRTFVLTTLAMLALGLTAAALRRYPYGVGERLQQYWTPAVCILMAQGVWSLTTAACRAASVPRALKVAGLLLLAVGVCESGYLLLRPYKYVQDYRHRAFAMSLWAGDDATAPIVSLSDLDERWTDQPYFQLTYVCLRAIFDKRFDYTAADPDAGRRRIEAMAPGTPLRVVAIGSVGEDWERQNSALWKQTLLRSYRQTGEIDFPITVGMDAFAHYTYHIWSFAPNDPSAHPSPARIAAQETRRR